ncbi:MAG: hypothetical protein ABIZ04_24145 [Opitutus sp.]
MSPGTHDDGHGRAANSVDGQPEPASSRERLFVLVLSGFVAMYAAYGLHRCGLGVDFTDEGAYLAWPLRLLFGERPFSSELHTLLRPIEVFMTWPFRLYPDITLYEFRMLGWTIHLGAFVTLAVFLFRWSGATVLSPLIASVPFFVSHIFGLASPSYNSLSSDFLLIALSLNALLAIRSSSSWPLGAPAGLALFVATLAHPALGVVAAVMLGREVMQQKLIGNLIHRRLTAGNFGALIFVFCWLLFVAYLVVTGAAATWWDRLETIRSLSAHSLPKDFGAFLTRLIAFPFIYSRAAIVSSLLILGSVAGLGFVAYRSPRYIGLASSLAAVMLAGTMAVTAATTASFLTTCLAATALSVLVALLIPLIRKVLSVDSSMVFLIGLSVLAGLVYASFTFYFTAHRSWVSGSLGLPFAFAVGMMAFHRSPPHRSMLARAALAAVLATGLVYVAREHHHAIYRDSPPAELQATFEAPKLRRIRSTSERVTAVNALFAHLSPRLSRGEPLVVYDDCPMLYYLFDAAPAYGLAWAVRYSQSAATLRQLNDELNAHPLPKYAIRTLVDVSYPIWAAAPRTSYANYPLNETVMARYELERTIFPFEVWKLRAGK